MHRDRGRRRRHSTEAVPGEVAEGRGEGRGDGGRWGVGQDRAITGDGAATGRWLGEAGDGERQVRIEIGKFGSEARVTIEDDGPGIPPENLETVFERFYTSRPRGALFGGNSGLGLSIARQIVEAHSGHIWAENRVDEEGLILGARFSVSLPCLST